MMREYTCPNCGEKFLFPDIGEDAEVFCSPECEYNFKTGFPGEQY